MMDGRVKTLHPNIFGGILSRDSDLEEVNKHKIKIIDNKIINNVDNGSDLKLIIEEIKELNINEITPLEALKILNDIKKKYNN